MSEDPTFQRVPPHSIDGEQAVLGGILLDSRRINEVLEILRPEHFYMQSHRDIYKAMMELSDKQLPLDVVTLKDKLEGMGKLDTIGGIEYISELASMVPTAANVAVYARIIREKALLRQTIEAGIDIVSEGFEEPSDVEEFLDRAEKRLFDVTQEKLEQPYHPIKSVVKEAFKRIEQLDENTGSVVGVPTGFTKLDQMTSGFQPSELIIVAARPSMGKTSLALNIAQNAALNDGAKVGIFSLEMSRTDLVIRMMCSIGRVDSQKFRTGHLDDNEWIKLVESADRLNNAPIYLDDTAGINVMALRAKARRMKMNHGLDMVLIDYLQLMQGTSSHRDQNREQEISQISRSLKALAKELEIPVIALSQLNRDLEKRQDKRPQMSDLRESGAIEQDADVILFIYRDIVYNPDNIEKETDGELIIAKQRSGPTGIVPVRYFREYTLFDNYIRDEDADLYR